MKAVVDRGRRAVARGAILLATPLFSTRTIPLITRRSSTRRAPGRFFGSNGSIAAHCASLNQNSLAIVKLLAELEPDLQSNLNGLIEFGA
jgi:hypothetical protein